MMEEMVILYVRYPRVGGALGATDCRQDDQALSKQHAQLKICRMRIRITSFIEEFVRLAYVSHTYSNQILV